ncbi:protein atonal-like protein 7 [Platysternon megacephalum]|uniref:ubiquitinyl hydrolase 1 n=1 Tax=Platysternon megacephalum TaxID=55544 RepID=A0A4D9EYC1_9SAUR|nr:protein atonal-like protein 7 [Platysternon megacephalum]
MAAEEPLQKPEPLGGDTDGVNCLAYDEAIMAQQDRIQQEIAVQNPLVSDRLELSVLYKEYAEDDHIYQQKIKDLLKKYSYIRKTRPDGNCFYRAFGFSHLEALLEDSKELQRSGEKSHANPDAPAPRKYRTEHKSRHRTPTAPPPALVTDPPPSSPAPSTPPGPSKLTRPAQCTLGCLSPLMPTDELMLPFAGSPPRPGPSGTFRLPSATDELLLLQPQPAAPFCLSPPDLSDELSDCPAFTPLHCWYRWL